MNSKTAVMLLLFTTLCTLLVAGEVKDPFENAKYKIMFVEEAAKGKNYLLTSDVNGNNRKRLTPAFNNIVFPKYNEMSGWVAFTNRTQEMKSEVYILNSQRTKVKRLIQDMIFQDFSPDGKQMLLTSADAASELYVYNILSKNTRRISQNHKVVSASYSNFGPWIAAAVINSKQKVSVYRYSTLAQGIFKISKDDNLNDAYPSFMDEDNILFFSNELSEKDTIVNSLILHSVKKDVRENLNFLGTNPSASPDGKFIAYENRGFIHVVSMDDYYRKVIGKGKHPTWIKN